MRCGARWFGVSRVEAGKGERRKAWKRRLRVRKLDVQFQEEEEGLVWSDGCV